MQTSRHDFVQIRDDTMGVIEEMQLRAMYRLGVRAEATLRSLINLNATFTSRPHAGTALIAAKPYKVFQVRVQYVPIRAKKFTYLIYCNFCRESGSNRS